MIKHHKQPRGPLFGALLIACCAMLLSACAHYQMGTPASPDGARFESIYVDWVDNETFEAEQIVPYTQAIREIILESSDFTLSGNPVNADAVLSITLSELDRQRQADRSDDTGLALIYRNEMTVSVSLEANTDGRIFLEEKTFTVSADALASQGLQASEYQQTPILARMLAQKILDTLIGLNW